MIVKTIERKTNSMIIKQWSVIGAGPSGILAIAKLIDSGIDPQQIYWVDPTFSVGDLSNKWSEVPSNTIVKLFVDYIKEMHCIEITSLSHFDLFQLPDNETCLLSKMAGPLQACTEQLRAKVTSIKSMVSHLELKNKRWHMRLTTGEELHASSVILANGASPLCLPLTPSIETLPLEVALAPSKLKESLDPNETIAVFGSSHSAILVLKNLIDLNAKKVINFYLSPCQYALNLGDWTLFDNTGLKGSAAHWAKENIDGTLPPNLIRVLSHEKNLSEHLKNCHKVISATGFHPNQTLEIKGVNSQKYQPQTGIIAPALFGFGIAFPERMRGPMDIEETKIGLWKFATYLKKVLPIWLKYKI